MIASLAKASSFKNCKSYPLKHILVLFAGLIICSHKNFFLLSAPTLFDLHTYMPSKYFKECFSSLHIFKRLVTEKVKVLSLSFSTVQKGFLDNLLSKYSGRFRNLFLLMHSIKK